MWAPFVPRDVPGMGASNTDRARFGKVKCRTCAGTGRRPFSHVFRDGI